MSLIKKTLLDIRFWIILFFVIRLIGITNPPLEVAHNWRQTTVTMAARNFLEVDNNILYPRIDFAGEKTGITGMEFPLLNYLIYLVSEIFGYEHWYGRLINLFFSSFGLFFFFKLIKKYFNKNIAFSSALVLLFSIWFAYSRKIMPDTFAMSFILSGIYFGTNYFDEEKKKSDRLINLVLFIILTALGSLSKLPSAYLLVVFILFFLNKKILLKRKIIFAIAATLSILPAILWYFYWVPYLVETYGFWHFFMGKSFSQGIHEIAANLNQTLQRFYDTALKYIGFIIFLFGLIHAVIKKQRLLIFVFILGFIGFLVIIFKAGYTFTHHSYYIIPFVPVMALITGYGIMQFKNKKLVLLLLLAVGFEGILNQQHDFRIHDKELALLNLEEDLNKVSISSNLILINSGNYPTPMYFAHRKGWINSNEKIKDDNYLQNLRAKGLKYIIILKKTFGTYMEMNLPIVLDNDNYCIYKL